jgi:Recombinase zinc beta ribbon domain
VIYPVSRSHWYRRRPSNTSKGQCGARLIISYVRGEGGTCPYFICIGRQRDKSSCQQRAVRIDQAEEAIAAHYATVQLPESEVAAL